MNPPRILFSLSFLSRLNQLTESFRIFLVSSIISLYGLVLYEAFPEMILDLNNAISYFILPMALLAGVTIGLPRAMPFIMEKIFKKPITKSTQLVETDQSDDILNQMVADGSSQQLVAPVNSDMIGGETGTSPGLSNKELDDIIAGVAQEGKSYENTVGLDPTSLEKGKNDSSLDESKVRDLVDQKFEPVEKDLSSFKKDLNKIKEDMKITKDSVDILTESFEGTLTDMKAFQAEISNPLNFMRKYFESLDLKILSDPSLPLRQQLNDQSVPIRTPLLEKEISTMPTRMETSQRVEASPNQLSLTKDAYDSGTQASDSNNPMDSVLKPLFSGSLSVGKMMSIVELAGDMLKEQGDDCIDLLIEQCKLMGLKSEDENSIYNIIDMLKNSGMNVEDSLIQLYKFSKIVGLTDPEADSHYSKLMANRARKKLGKGE
jgi:hypothetical protein